MIGGEKPQSISSYRCYSEALLPVSTLSFSSSRWMKGNHQHIQTSAEPRKSSAATISLGQAVPSCSNPLRSPHLSQPSQWFTFFTVLFLKQPDPCIRFCASNMLYLLCTTSLSCHLVLQGWLVVAQPTNPGGVHPVSPYMMAHEGLQAVLPVQASHASAWERATPR